MNRHIVIAIACLLLFSVASAEAKFRALLVGINYQNADPDIPRLSGAIHDVQDMSDLMTKTLGIPASSIRTLTEGQATRAAILQNFREWLIDRTTEGDVVFFQYSGHGASIPDPTGSQKIDPLKQHDAKGQALAEAFVPFDAEVDAEWKSVANLILDSELHLLLNALKGRKVLLFLDSCYSGGVTRDFTHTKMVGRYLQLPWDPRETRMILPADFPKDFPADVLRGTKRARQPDPSWYPEYTYFAAVKYFQMAHDLYENGAFTLSVLRLLQANPNATNKQVLAYARKYIHQDLGIPEAYQEPVFYGPQGAPDEPFVLLTQRPSETVVALIPTSPTQPMPAVGKTAVWLTGQEGQIKTQLLSAIGNSEYLQLNDTHPDAIVEVMAEGVNIHNAFGKRLEMIAMKAEVVVNVLKALEGLHIVRQLAVLENPAAPFAVRAQNYF
jgi:hypothetical protein